MKQNIRAMLLICLPRVRSTNDDGNEWGQAPSNITVERLEKNKVLLRWKDNSNNEAGLSILQRKAVTSKNIKTEKVTANINEFHIEEELSEKSICLFKSTLPSEIELYEINSPLPYVKGEAKYDAVSNKKPNTKINWEPKYALSAGPVLLKDSKIPFDFTETSKGSAFYLSNYEIIPYNIFGPNVTPDRTEIGYRENEKVIIFICDGRIASNRFNLTELAQITKGLSYVRAINLDGGTSTGMISGKRSSKWCCRRKLSNGFNNRIL